MRSPLERDSFADPADSPRLFARIAARYDAMNRLMSLGRDRHWRKLAAAALDLPVHGTALDVGVGTGDMALAISERWPDATVVGVDPTRAMMAHGRGKAGMEPVDLAQGTGLRLPFRSQIFDAVVSAFVMRNVVDVEQALGEQYRVVREGGRVACLEMSWPRTGLFGALFRCYFSSLMPRLTGLLTGHPAAYRYLPRSVERFQTPEELKLTMERVDLRDVCHRKLALGTVTLHVGVRGSQVEKGDPYDT